LTVLHKSCMLMHMRSALNIDDRLIEEARRLTGIKETSALIAREIAPRLAALGGTSRVSGRRRKGVRSERLDDFGRHICDGCLQRFAAEHKEVLGFVVWRPA
jgi:hypothetical protein